MQKNVLRISLHFNFEYICNRLCENRKKGRGELKKKMAAKKRYFVFVRISLEYFRIFPTSDGVQNGTDGEKGFRGSQVREIKGEGKNRFTGQAMR